MKARHQGFVAAAAVLTLLTAWALAQSRRARTIGGPSTIGWGPSARHNYLLRR